jgi:hypothetical protein
VTRSARKHKIGNAHILAAMQNAGKPVLVPGMDQLLYVGRDDRGIELLIIAVPDNRDPGGLAVIHAMPTGLGKRED